MNQKKVVTLILGIIFSMLAFYSMLAWINNISVALQWHHDVVQKTEEVTTEKVIEKKEAKKKTDKSSKAVKEEKEKKKEKVYKGPMSYLDWTCVDMTTVSTLVPFLGFSLIGLGFFRILMFKKEDAVISKNFPFFEDCDRIMVILGLAGTLWGIIMLGYYPSDEVKMPQLVICLHTALYSTLVAVLWVFLISRPTRDAMHWWYGKVTGKETRGNADISAIFRELGAVVSGSAKEFKSAGIEAAEFKKQTEAAKREFEGVITFFGKFKEQNGLDIFGATQNLLTSLTNSCQTINESLKALRTEFRSSQRVIEEQEKLIKKQQDFLNQLNKKLAAEMRLRQEAEQKTAKAGREKNEAVSRLEQFKSLFKTLK